MTDERKPKGVEDAHPASFQADAGNPEAAKSGGRTLKVRRIGNSLGVVLPKEVLAKLRAGEGDKLTVSDTRDGVALRLCDGEFQEQIEAARRAMKRYRNALRELAK